MKIQRKINSQLLSQYLGFFLLFFCSLRAIFRYGYLYNDTITIFVYLSVYALIFYLIYKDNLPFRNILISLYISTAVILFFIAVFYIYPIADDLKLIGKGSDQDDCTKGIIDYLLQGINPYHFLSYNGNNCSQGPGTIMIFFPFVYINQFILANVFYTLLLIGTLFKFNYDVVKFTLTFSSGVIIWEILSVGSDLYAAGILLAISVIILREACIQKNSKLLILSIFFICIFSTTRINLIFIPFAVSMMIYFYWKKGSLLFLILSLFFYFVFFGSLFYINSSFISIDNIHDFSFITVHLNTASGFKGTTLLYIGFLTTLVSFFFAIIYIIRKNEIKFIDFFLILVTAPHLLAVMINDLKFHHYDFSNWEGANYLMPIIPTIIAVSSKKRPIND